MINITPDIFIFTNLFTFILYTNIKISKSGTKMNALEIIICIIVKHNNKHKYINIV